MTLITDPIIGPTRVRFPGTAVPSTDVNTLDAYVEGNWTPSIGGTATYASQDGKYIKIGKLVWIYANIEITLLGTGSATVISGLPFAVETQTSHTPLAVGYFAALPSNVVWLAAYALTGTTTIQFASLAAAAASATTPFTAFANGTRILFSGCYRASA